MINLAVDEGLCHLMVYCGVDLGEDIKSNVMVNCSSATELYNRQ
jgi:hypothetical protein